MTDFIHQYTFNPPHIFNSPQNEEIKFFQIFLRIHFQAHILDSCWKEFQNEIAVLEMKH